MQNAVGSLDRLFSLEHRLAFVTGGSSGIGAAIARALAGAGARVILIARTQADLAEATEALRADGRDADWVAGDLSDRSSTRQVAEETVSRFGEPDILVNAAGVNLRPPMSELTEDQWDLTIRTNLEAPFLLGQRLAPGMATRGYGRLISISSQQAHRAFVQSGAYGVSKAGLEALARSQAEAWSASGVTSNVLVPGFVLTPLNRRLASDPATVAALAARTLVGRNGVPDDFAGPAVFLASAASGYVTGQTIFVDGGFGVH